MYSRLLNREIMSALQISWATNAQSLGAAPQYLWCLPWSAPSFFFFQKGFCFHSPSSWGVGLGEPSVWPHTTALCSCGLWENNFISLTLEGLMEKSCSAVGSRFFSREISIYLPRSLDPSWVIQSHAESSHSFVFLSTELQNYEETQVKNSSCGTKVRKVLLCFLARLEWIVTKSTEAHGEKNSTSQRIFLKISVVFESVSNGRSSRGRK